MTPEKQTKDPNAQKQKIIIIVIVVIVLIVLWQFIGIGGGSETPSIAPTPVASAPGKPAAGNAMQTPGAAAAPMASSAPPAVPEIKQEKISTNSDISKLQLQSQTEYISSLNKLQMLKLQREIDETKMAIATAELNRMTAEQNIANLITSKQEIIPPPAIDMSSSPSAAPVPVPAAPVVADFPYVVMSVAYEGRKWTAVVSAGSNGTPTTGVPGAGPVTPPKMYTVNVGDTLPPDGSTVMAIDKQGITVKKNTSTRTISLTSSGM